MSSENKLRAIVALSRRAFGKYKPQIAILTLLGFLAGILEGIGINAVIPLFSVIAGGNEATDFISQYIEKFFMFFNMTLSIKYLLIFVVLLFVGRALALVLTYYIKIKITADYEKKTRESLFAKTLKANWPYLLKQKLGYLETVIMTDVNHSAGLLDQISSIIMLLTSLLIYTLVAVNISFNITLATFVLGGIIFLIFKPFIYKSRIFSHESAKMNKKVAHHVNESISGMKAIKSGFVGNRVINIGEGYFNKLKELRISLALLKHITSAFIQPIGLIFICVIFAISYKLPNFNFAALAAIIYLIQRIFSYIQQLQAHAHVINGQVPFLKEVLEYEDMADKHKEYKGGVTPFSFKHSLEFTDINFSYNQEKDILSKINFKIKKGEMVGIVGPSGSGKTTVVDLLLRLLEPINGSISLDGRNIREISMRDWRSNIGYVSQDIFLMNDTVMNNIKFYDSSVKEKDVIEAAKMANIYSFIKTLPDGLRTNVGERGVMLSGGQKQRIIIARILAKKPKILVLDEATSALDGESEMQIQQVISALKGKITVVVIAHRLSTVMNADKLLVLDKGVITETGSPRDLLKNKESYFTKAYHLRK